MAHNKTHKTNSDTMDEGKSTAADKQADDFIKQYDNASVDAVKKREGQLKNRKYA
jgi:hypothetical protein